MSTEKAKISAMAKAISVEARWQLYRILSILWILPSIGAVCILARSAKGTAGGWFSSVPIENWVALLLLGFHAVFVALMLRWRRRFSARRALQAIGKAN